MGQIPYKVLFSSKPNIINDYLNFCSDFKVRDGMGRFRTYENEWKVKNGIVYIHHENNIWCDALPWVQELYQAYMYHEVVNEILHRR